MSYQKKAERGHAHPLGCVWLCIHVSHSSSSSIVLPSSINYWILNRNSVNIFHVDFIISVILIASRAQPALIGLKIRMSQQMSLIMNLRVDNFSAYLALICFGPYFMFSSHVFVNGIFSKGRVITEGAAEVPCS